MSKISLKGSPFNTIGELPPSGVDTPDFELVKTDLSSVSISSFQGKKIILNIFPSIDTPVCAVSVRRFNQDAGEQINTVVLCVSMDLPFAQARFCGAEGLDNVIMLSDFRTGQFGRDYGVRIIDGPLQGLLSRAVLVIDEGAKILYSQQVEEVTQEPDYELALSFL
jgi:thiol peroxidase